MTKPKPERDAKGRLLPGQPPLNPGGRPKGVAAMAKALSKDGEGREVLEFYFQVMRTESEKTSDRLDAANELANRMFGKCAQPLTGEDGKGAVKVEGLRGLLLEQPEELLKSLASQLEKERGS